MSDAQNAASSSEGPMRLRDALRKARIEAADRTGVVVDLRDAELARIELLNEALDPLFADIPDTIELFDRGISRGDTPRLWIDAIAHVEMGRDKRQYRFLQDSRYGRTVLAESHDVPELVKAVTRYVARRMVERERALADDSSALLTSEREARFERQRRFWRGLRMFLFGLAMGVFAVVAAALLSTQP